MIINHIQVEESTLSNLLGKEEFFWAQKSRSNWLKWGDRISKFFHLSTIKRRNFNRILSLKDNNNEWVHGDDNIVNLSKDYFSNIFSSSNPNESQIKKVSDNYCIFLSKSAKESFNSEFSKE